MSEYRDFREETIEEKSIFQGRIVHLKTLQVRLPNGHVSTREVVMHPGAVAVVAEVEPGRLLLVEQFRKAPDETLWEVPAGKLEAGEDPAVCAARELAEETGYVAEKITKLYEFYTSPGFANERITLFAAEGLREGPVNPDDDEFVRVFTVTRLELSDALATGRIRDAKTLVAALWWLQKGEGTE